MANGANREVLRASQIADLYHNGNREMARSSLVGRNAPRSVKQIAKLTLETVEELIDTYDYECLDALDRVARLIENQPDDEEDTDA